MFPAEQVAALDRALKTYGAAQPRNEQETAKLERYRAMHRARKVEKHPERAVRYDAFHPGKPWLDTKKREAQEKLGQVMGL